MNEQFLDKDGLQVVADKVNNKISTVTEMPGNVSHGIIVLYKGEDTEQYSWGHIYESFNTMLYAWKDSENHVVYTDIETPENGSALYATSNRQPATNENQPELVSITVVSYNSSNSTITDTSDYTYTRESSLDFDSIYWDDMTATVSGIKLVNTINYTKTQNYCSQISNNGDSVGMTIPFDELESYSDGNYTARIHVMVARKMRKDLYFKTFIDIPITKGTDPNTGLTIKSYGFIPEWSQADKVLPSSNGVYNNGIEVFMERGTYNGAERDVVGLYYHYSTFDDVKTIIVYMPTEIGFITNSQITTYIEKIQIFKLG